MKRLMIILCMIVCMSNLNAMVETKSVDSLDKGRIQKLHELAGHNAYLVESIVINRRAGLHQDAKRAHRCVLLAVSRKINDLRYKELFDEVLGEINNPHVKKLIQEYCIQCQRALCAQPRQGQTSFDAVNLIIEAYKTMHAEIERLYNSL